MKTKMSVSVFFVVVMLNLLFSVSAHALSMDAGASMTDGFDAGWIAGQPDITNTSNLGFKSNNVNFYLDPSGVSGDFAWDGSGIQPDYTMDPSGDPTQYAGHIGGSTSSLNVGNYSNYFGGQDFMTWYVDVPSLGMGQQDLIHFDLVSEQIISTSITGNSKNLSIYLIGSVWDDNAYWDSSLASINLTVSQTGTSTYSWAATWASPPSPNVPEPASLFLMGLGLALVVTVVVFRKARKGQSTLQTA